MSLNPNSQNIDRVAAGVSNATPVSVHPEYTEFHPQWIRIRDCIAGQDAIKSAGSVYLRPLKGMQAADFEDYLHGSVFFGITGQTQRALLGQLSHRDPAIGGLPAKLKDKVNVAFGKGGSGHAAVCRTVMGEQIAMGRVGVLVDMAATESSEPEPYVCVYQCTDILDWEVRSIGGRNKLARVLLREFEREQAAASDQNPWIGKPLDAINARRAAQANALRPNTRKAASVYTYKTIYRELSLELQRDGSYVYVQNVYDSDPSGDPIATHVPRVRGQSFDFLPFVFFGATDNGADVERSPLADIAALNLSHYKSYAEIEYARKYLALPTIYITGREDDGAAEYSLGPSTVWELPTDANVGFLEFKGEGLAELRLALSTKEAQAIALGARLLNATTTASLSDGQAELRESNEQAMILSVLNAAGTGMAQVVRFWAFFRDVPLAESEALEYTINRNFIGSEVGYRELRAIQMLYEAGLVPLETLHSFLQDADVFDACMSIEDLRKLLSDSRSFVNAPDAQARVRGFSSRQQELDAAQQSEAPESLH